MELRLQRSSETNICRSGSSMTWSSRYYHNIISRELFYFWQANQDHKWHTRPQLSIRFSDGKLLRLNKSFFPLYVAEAASGKGYLDPRVNAYLEGRNY